MPAGRLTPCTAPVSLAELRRLAKIAERLWPMRTGTLSGHNPQQRRIGAGTLFCDFRDYCPGDDVRHIDWRATARTQRPQTRRYLDENSDDWLIAIDASASMLTGGAAKWQRAAELAYAFSYVLLHLGQRVALNVFHGDVIRRVQVGRGHRHLRHLASQLQTPAALSGPANPLACLVDGSGRSLILISDLLRADGMLDDLSRLAMRATETHVLQVTDDADLRIDTDADATLILESVENGRRLPIHSRDRDAARHRLAGLCAQIDRFCTRRRLPRSICPVEQSWSSSLMGHLARLGRRRA